MTDQAYDANDIVFRCNGKASGKMRADMDVRLEHPMKESFQLATDEGKFHGGDGSAPLPLALFVGGLTGCLMTQIRAFGKRMKVPVDDLSVDCEVIWRWTPVDRIYETEPKGFHFDIHLESSAPLEQQVALIEAAKKGCFIEQTLGQKNEIRHRLKTSDGFHEIEA